MPELVSSVSLCDARGNRTFRVRGLLKRSILLPSAMTTRILLCVCLLFSVSCALGPRVEIEDPEIFPSAPRLVRKGERYFLRCERTPFGAARPRKIRCEVEGDHLLVYVSILVSAQRDLQSYPEHAAGRLMDYPLVLPSRLQHTNELTGRVFWLNPDGTQHPLEISSSAEAGILPASARGRSH